MNSCLLVSRICFPQASARLCTYKAELSWGCCDLAKLQRPIPIGAADKGAQTKEVPWKMQLTLLRTQW